MPTPSQINLIKKNFLNRFSLLEKSKNTESAQLYM